MKNNTILENEYSEDKYYSHKLPTKIKNGLVKYSTRGIDWYGDPDQMIVVSSDSVDGMYGNTYNHDKLKSITNMIKTTRDGSVPNMEISCGYATATVVSLQEITEEQESVIGGTFRTDYDGHDTPLTTGDGELDRYITSEGISLIFDYAEPDEIVLFEKLKFGIVHKEYTEDQLREKLSDSIDVDLLDEFIDKENELNDAVNSNDGDLGRFKIQVRDGHHRTMGAISAGEPTVCVNLVKEDLYLIEGKSNVEKVN